MILVKDYDLVIDALERHAGVLAQALEECNIRLVALFLGRIVDGFVAAVHHRHFCPDGDVPRDAFQRVAFPGLAALLVPYPSAEAQACPLDCGLARRSGVRNRIKREGSGLLL